MLGSSLGVASTGLKDQFVVIRVNRIDGDLFKRKLVEAGQSSAIAPAVLMAVDTAPKFAIDVALPMAAKELEKYGIFATLSASDAPLAQGERKKSEFLPGFVIGSGIVATVAAIGWGAWKLVLNKLFT